MYVSDLAIITCTCKTWFCSLQNKTQQTTSIDQQRDYHNSNENACMLPWDKQKINYPAQHRNSKYFANVKIHSMIGS